MEKETKIESREQPERNLLNSYTTTVDAMGEIEGEAWRNLQERDSVCTTKGALEMLHKFGPTEDPEDYQNSVFTVYGAGGYNRWFVLRDGTVCFSFQHGREDVPKAEALGFKIFR